MANYFVTGIGTGIGKTLISAILTEKLKADYWKPIQAGDLETSDSLNVERLITNTKTFIHPERFKLNTPASPHYAAKLDDIEIQLNDFNMPKTENNLIIEGAGGIMVPLNEKDLLLDLIIKLGAEIILISQNYLGSINHTLLSVNILKQHDIKIRGIIFNGKENLETQRYILQYTGCKFLGHIPNLKQVDKGNILSAGEYIDLNQFQ